MAERRAGAKVLLWPTALGGRVNDVGSKAWERTLAKDFKLEHTGVPGRLPVGPDGVQESAIDGVAAAVDDGRAGHIKILSLGQSHGRQAMGSGRYSCWVTRSAGRRARAASRSEWSQESATDVVADVSLMTAVLDTWNIPSLSQCPGRQSVDSGRGFCSGGTMRLEGGLYGRPARVESRVQYHVWSSNAPLMTDVRDT